MKTTEMEENMDKQNTNVEEEQQKMLTIMSELVDIGKKKDNVVYPS